MAKKQNQKLRVNLSQGDLEDLLNGETFDWTFTTNKGEDIDIHLFNDMDMDEDDE